MKPRYRLHELDSNRDTFQQLVVKELGLSSRIVETGSTTYTARNKRARVLLFLSLFYLKGLELQGHGVALVYRDFPDALLVGAVVIRVVGAGQEALVFVDLTATDSWTSRRQKVIHGHLFLQS